MSPPIAQELAAHLQVMQCSVSSTRWWIVVNTGSKFSLLRDDFTAQLLVRRLDTALVDAICTAVQQRLGPASFDAPTHAVDQETRVQVRFAAHAEQSHEPCIAAGWLCNRVVPMTHASSQ